MNLKFLFLSTLLLMITLQGCAGTGEVRNRLKQAEQLIVVTTPNWNEVKGTMSLYEKSQDGWKKVKDVRIIVGKNGMAWGSSLFAKPERRYPDKKEGDGRAPAGIFSLGTLFGFDPPEKLPPLRYPYLQITEEHKCVDDPQSEFYNLIVQESAVRKDWKSQENMLQVGEQYRIGLFMNHNSFPRTPMGGSCIFFHIWENDSTATSGCTAMDASEMLELATWLRADALPTVVQMPEDIYRNISGKFGLPAR